MDEFLRFVAHRFVLEVLEPVPVIFMEVVMALARWKTQELREFAYALRDAGDLILKTCEKMELANMESLVLQASAATSTYGPAIFRLAGSIDAEFVDQHTAAKLGRIPRWQQNQKKVEAKAERDRLKKLDLAQRREGIKAEDSAIGIEGRETEPT